MFGIFLFENRSRESADKADAFEFEQRLKAVENRPQTLQAISDSTDLEEF